jgi:hypothetical protein
MSAGDRGVILAGVKTLDMNEKKFAMTVKFKIAY